MADPIQIASLMTWFRAKVLPTMNPRWEDVTYFPPTRRQWDKHYTFYMRGITKDEPPRYFLAYTNVDPKILAKGKAKATAYLESKALVLALKLDDFLHPLCKCVPAHDGSLGAPCEYHQGRSH